MACPFQRALISVSDKTGIIELAQQLADEGVEIVSTGGTASHLQLAGIPVTSVSSVTGFPEILDGRVKTLHPLIHGGILANPSDPDHAIQLQTLGITPFQLLIINLYPFRQTVLNHPEDEALILENIDIGGPCMIRAAAKNFHHVLVITDPADYGIISDHLTQKFPFSIQNRRNFALKAFSHTSRYDHLIQMWMSSHPAEDITLPALPDCLHLMLERVETLRYGENPHQLAAIYRTPFSPDTGSLAFRQLSGKEISFNNLLDAQAAWNLVMQFHLPGAVVIKHQNPCGAAVNRSISQAFQQALSCDPVSAFGGIVALNRPVDIETAQLLNEAHFLEVIVAPDYSQEGLELLKRKKNRRLLQLKEPAEDDQPLDVRLTHNGALVQTSDRSRESRDDFKVITVCSPSESEWDDILFGWTVCRFVKSNAIVCAHKGRAIGVGAGQMSRVESVAIALRKAAEQARGGILASDAFFPFKDSVELAAEAGIKALIQPGGSKGDQEVIDACNHLNIAMVFTGVRHFKH